MSTAQQCRLYALLLLTHSSAPLRDSHHLYPSNPGSNLPVSLLSPSLFIAAHIASMPQKPQRKLSAALASPSAPLPMPPSSTTKPKSFAEISSTYASRFNTSSSKSKSRAKFNQETDEERQQRIESAADGADQYYDFATEAYLSVSLLSP